MKAFGQIDFVGDACIRILAKEYQPQNPNEWNERFGRNSFLAELYIAVMGDKTPPLLTIHPKKDKTHLRASHVEAWLGTAFEYGGIEEVKMYWERLIRLWTSWKREKITKSAKRGLVKISIMAKEAGAMYPLPWN